VVREEVLRSAPASLRTYVVWVPVLDDDDRISASAASGLLPDEAAEQFFDPDAQLARALGNVLRIPPHKETPESAPAPHGLAWDVYLLYAPGGNSTSTTGPITCVILPTFCISVIATAMFVPL
jgi:hypothetical protein